MPSLVMSFDTLFTLALVLLPAAGLVIGALLVMAQVEEDLGRFVVGIPHSNMGRAGGVGESFFPGQPDDRFSAIRHATAATPGGVA